MTHPDKLVAVVVPMSDRPTLTDDEATSFRHLEHFLSGYDRYLVVPRSMDISPRGCRLARFDDRFFGSVAANRALMLSPEFYEAFSAYEYILIYHLDALAFSDELREWCGQGYDYIGAPWLRSVFEPVPQEAGFACVGNGGFSLRRVAAMLRVLRSNRFATEPADYWRRHVAALPPVERLRRAPRGLAKRLRAFNNVRREVANVDYNEDLFWSRRATWFDPSFKIAPVDVGLRFAFEEGPRYCFEQNGRRLPFGCHAWPKYDREFWEPYLLTESRVGD